MSSNAMLKENTVLSMKNICKRYGATNALQDVDFSVNAGEVHALVGENGAGKSTLIKILAGAVPKDSGTIHIEGKKVELREPVDARRRGIRVVYQDFSLFPNITVGENLVVGRWIAGIPGLVDWEKCYAQAETILNKIGFRLDLRKSLSSLSVAEKQMLEIAKAVSEKPKILVLDEPTAVLEEDETRQLFQVIYELKKEGTGIVYISHRLDEIFSVADRVTVLKDGQVVSTQKTSQTDKHDLIIRMVGRDLGELFPARMAQKGQPVLEVRNFACNNYVHDVNFTLHEGEIVGFAGLTGSGRTNIARCVFGADPFSGGEIILNGRQVNFKSPGAAIANGIAFLTEDRKKDGLFLGVSIRNNISAACLHVFNRCGIMTDQKESMAVADLMHKMSVKPNDPTKAVRQLSGGNQQKVALAKWLLTDAKVIILDQPTWGVDVGTMVEIYNFIAELAASGKAIMLISCVLPEVLGLSDRIIVMRDGTIVKELNRNEATEENIISYAMGVSQ